MEAIMTYDIAQTTRTAEQFRTMWASLAESPEAEGKAAEVSRTAGRTAQMVSIAVLAELEGEFRHGDPLQAAINSCSLSDDDLETAMECKAEWIEKNYN